MRAYRCKIGEVLTLHGCEWTVVGHEGSYTKLESHTGNLWTVSTEHVRFALKETRLIKAKENQLGP